MNAIAGGIRDWSGQVAGGWDRFWFTAVAPHTLSLIRVLAGAMLFYTHLVWSLDLMAFLGPNSWMQVDVVRQLYAGTTGWSYLWYLQSPTALWTAHLAALVVFAMLMLGVATRIVSVLAWLITISYCHRLSGSLFGLDQVNAMLAMYLMIGPSGAMYSVDRWIAGRWRSSWLFPTAEPSISANVAIRFIQLHMCVIYLFGGIGKMRGELWWDGTALWYSIANLEYQSFDMTWLGAFPLLIAWMSHVTIFWETFYCAIVWHRLTRPIALGLAFMVHGGIALFLGMITFGLAMIIGNLAFFSPATTERIMQGLGRLFSTGGRQPTGGPTAAHPHSSRRRPAARRHTGRA